jgi:hypothetical protein
MAAWLHHVFFAMIFCLITGQGDGANQTWAETRAKINHYSSGKLIYTCGMMACMTKFVTMVHFPEKSTRLVKRKNGHFLLLWKYSNSFTFNISLESKIRDYKSIFPNHT